MLAKKQLNREKAVERAKKIQNTWEFARNIIREAQDQHAKTTNKYRREID
jgi:hypothetical protein